MKSAAVLVSVLMQMIPLAGMNVTEGGNEVRQLASGLIEIQGPRFRAVETATRSNPVQIDFAFRGEVEGGEPLESGEYRIQIGQKLLAQDPCNLVYVMWRLYPTESIVISVKRSAGSTSAECGNRGYTNIASVAVPASLSARGGQKRSLRSEYDPGSRLLQVRAGGRLLWQGVLPASLVGNLRGPSGVRSDNGVFRFKLFGAF